MSKAEVQKEPELPNLPAVADVAMERQKKIIFGTVDKADLQGEVMAKKIEECVLANAKRERECKAKIALSLHYAKTYRSYKFLGYGDWREYAMMWIEHHKLFRSIRTLDRFVAAVNVWVYKLGYDIDILREFEPSLLGEVAQTRGDDLTPEEAEAYIELLKTRGGGAPTAIRRSLEESRAVKRAELLPEPGPGISSKNDKVEVITPTQAKASGPNHYIEDEEIDPIDTGELSEEETQSFANLSRKADHIVLQIVDDEDEEGPLHFVQLYHGGTENGRPSVTYCCRHFEMRHLTKEEASLIEQEKSRIQTLRDIDDLMKEPE